MSANNKGNFKLFLVQDGTACNDRTAFTTELSCSEFNGPRADDPSLAESFPCYLDLQTRPFQINEAKTAFDFVLDAFPKEFRWILMEFPVDFFRIYEALPSDF